MAPNSQPFYSKCFTFRLKQEQQSFSRNHTSWCLLIFFWVSKYSCGVLGCQVRQSGLSDGLHEFQFRIFSTMMHLLGHNPMLSRGESSYLSLHAHTERYELQRVGAGDCRSWESLGYARWAIRLESSESHQLLSDGSWHMRDSGKGSVWFTCKDMELGWPSLRIIGPEDVPLPWGKSSVWSTQTVYWLDTAHIR